LLSGSATPNYIQSKKGIGYTAVERIDSMGREVYPSLVLRPAKTAPILSHTVTLDPTFDPPNIEDAASVVGSKSNELSSFPTKMLSFGLFHHLSIKELVTTLTLEKAMAAPAIIGWRLKPSGRKNPIANGIPRML
jgi:hypothetical protein